MLDADRCASESAVGKRAVKGGRYYLLGLLLREAKCKFNDGGRGGDQGAWSPVISWASEAGRVGVSARLLMAGIWGVIERSGRPGARVGLHEQLNVIRPRPSGSSWVTDNPAAFLQGPRHQTGGGRRAGREGLGPVLQAPDAPGVPGTPGTASSCTGVGPVLRAPTGAAREERGDVVRRVLRSEQLALHR